MNDETHAENIAGKLVNGVSYLGLKSHSFIVSLTECTSRSVGKRSKKQIVSEERERDY